MTSILAYLGLCCLLASAVAAIRPRLVRLRSRRQVLPILAAGVVLASVGAWWPHGMRRATQGTLLAEYLPQSQFGEFHSTVVRASPDEVFRAIRSVTADEIRFFRVLTWIRSPRLPGKASPEDILAPDWQAPILDVALRGGFVLLGQIPEEMVIGTVVCCGPSPVETAEDFLALTGPGYARAAMNFRVESAGAGTSRVITETRVFGTDRESVRVFARYWRAIFPGSAILRLTWLRAIKAKAERPRP